MTDNPIAAATERAEKMYNTIRRPNWPAWADLASDDRAAMIEHCLDAPDAGPRKKRTVSDVAGMIVGFIVIAIGVSLLGSAAIAGIVWLWGVIL